MAVFSISFVTGEPIARFPTPQVDNLTLVNPDGSQVVFAENAREVQVPILGSGHFGAVVRAVDSIGLQRVVKFLETSRFVPTPRLAGEPELSTGTMLVADLTREIQTTNRRLFKNVVPVVQCGTAQDVAGRAIPYAVSPFIDGPLLDAHLSDALADALRSKRTVDRHALHDLFLDLVDDLLGALVELEEAQVSHIDLKPGNIVVQRAGLRHPNVRDQAFVIDFAGAISRQPQPEGSRVPLMYTKWFFPEAAKNEVVRDVEGRVDHAALAKWGPTIDRHCLARTFEAIVVDIPGAYPGDGYDEGYRRAQRKKEAGWRYVLQDDFEVICGLIRRLRADSPTPFDSAPSARRAFQSIARHSSSDVLASRALTDRTRGVVINVGLRTVRVAPPLSRIVDHPVFQRLRRLQQLTLISDIFPAATHSRFTHVLNTFGLAKDYLMALNRDATFRLACTHRDVEQILAAALLHDLGQYAFSHTLEDLRKVGDRFSIDALRGIKHDQELVKDYIDRDEGGTSIRSILEDAGLQVDHVLHMIGKDQRRTDFGAATCIGRDIVSGVIDADRVSYLLQDSRSSGTSFGDAINVDQLVDALCIRSENGSVSVAIQESGVSAVEAVLAAVYWMYRNVYWHPVNRGMMVGLKHVMWDLCQHGNLSFAAYESRVYGESERHALRFLSGEYEEFLSKNGSGHNPIASIAAGRRSEMYRVWSIGGTPPSRSDPESASGVYWSIYKALARDSFKKLVHAIGAALPAGAAPRRGEILVDIPMKKRIFDSAQEILTGQTDTETEVGRREPLWVKLKHGDSRGGWVLLERHTPLVKALADAEDLRARKVRVFFAKGLLDRLTIDRSQLWRLVDAALREVVGAA